MNIDDGPSTSAAAAAAALPSRFRHSHLHTDTETAQVNVEVISDSDGSDSEDSHVGLPSSSSESSGGVSDRENGDDDDVNANDDASRQQQQNPATADQQPHPHSSVVLEAAEILGQTLQLPQDLCDSKLIFDEFFSLDTWNGLPATAQAHLQQFLPQFGMCDAEQNADEQARTILGLFGGAPTAGVLERFGVAPMSVLQANLEDGNYRPDIAHVRAVIRRQQRREQRFQEAERVSRMAKELLVRRERLLRQAYDAPPGERLRTDRRCGLGGVRMLPAETLAQRRSKKRYFSEVAGIAAQCGLVEEDAEVLTDDEQCPGGRPEVMARKTRKYLNGILVGAMSPGSESRVQSTTEPRGGTMEYLVGQGGVLTLADDFYRQCIYRHKRRKFEEPDHMELDTTDIDVAGVLARTQLSAKVRRTLIQAKTAAKKAAKLRAANATAAAAAAVAAAESTFLPPTPASPQQPTPASPQAVPQAARLLGAGVFNAAATHFNPPSPPQQTQPPPQSVAISRCESPIGHKSQAPTLSFSVIPPPLFDRLSSPKPFHPQTVLSPMASANVTTVAPSSSSSSSPPIASPPPTPHMPVKPPPTPPQLPSVAVAPAQPPTSPFSALAAGLSGMRGNSLPLSATRISPVTPAMQLELFAHDDDDDDHDDDDRALQSVAISERDNDSSQHISVSFDDSDTGSSRLRSHFRAVSPAPVAAAVLPPPTPPPPPPPAVLAGRVKTPTIATPSRRRQHSNSNSNSSSNSSSTPSATKSRAKRAAHAASDIGNGTVQTQPSPVARIEAATPADASPTICIDIDDVPSFTIRQDISPYAGHSHPEPTPISLPPVTEITTITTMTPSPVVVARLPSPPLPPLSQPLPTVLHMPQYGGTVKVATMSDLEGIDMMHLPIDLDDSGHMDILHEIDVVDVAASNETNSFTTVAAVSSGANESRDIVVNVLSGESNPGSNSNSVVALPNISQSNSNSNSSSIQHTIVVAPQPAIERPAPQPPRPPPPPSTFTSLAFADDSSIDMDDSAPELMQATHSSFFALIRDVFCATANHRTTIDHLHVRVAAWLRNPIAALNDWFAAADDWLDVIGSGIRFLAGEWTHAQPDEFVPYVEYKPQLEIYQWIGAGRDSDGHLRPLCDCWLERRAEVGAVLQVYGATTADCGVGGGTLDGDAMGGSSEGGSRSKAHFNNSGSSFTSLLEDESNASNATSGGGPGSSSAAERAASPPPPRFPTAWTVAAASDTEIAAFRVQERDRFNNPHLAFTYHMHGFESVVGPVKGIYTQVPVISKARGHNMLTLDRPNFVTILTLVRDATARLPNGEGTRSDICELLRSSQYINSDATDSVLQPIVSGALDRMHTEHDPCVRFDTKRKIWIYLHRDRGQEEFERMHQQFQGLSKHRKQSHRKGKKSQSYGGGGSLLKSPVTPTAVRQQQQQQQQQQHTPQQQHQQTTPVKTMVTATVVAASPVKPIKLTPPQPAQPKAASPVDPPKSIVVPSVAQKSPAIQPKSINIPAPSVVKSPTIDTQMTSVTSPTPAQPAPMQLPALSSILPPPVSIALSSPIVMPKLTVVSAQRTPIKAELVPLKSNTVATVKPQQPRVDPIVETKPQPMPVVQHAPPPIIVAPPKAPTIAVTPSPGPVKQPPPSRFTGILMDPKLMQKTTKVTAHTKLIMPGSASTTATVQPNTASLLQPKPQQQQPQQPPVRSVTPLHSYLTVHGTTPIDVSTPTGIQTVHVSVANHSQLNQQQQSQPQQQPQRNISTPMVINAVQATPPQQTSQPQPLQHSILLSQQANNRSASPLFVHSTTLVPGGARKIVKTISQMQAQQQTQQTQPSFLMPSLQHAQQLQQQPQTQPQQQQHASKIIVSVAPTNASQQQSVQLVSAPSKILRTFTIPPTMATAKGGVSLLQNTNKVLAARSATTLSAASLPKSLINANVVGYQQQPQTGPQTKIVTTKVVAAHAGMPVRIQPQLQPHLAVATTSTAASTPILTQKINVTTSRGQPTTLTPAQQRQILQNIIAQQKQQRAANAAAQQQTALSFVTSSSITNPSHPRTVIVSQSPMTQKTAATTIATSIVTTLASAGPTSSSVPAGTSLINRQIIQIQQQQLQQQQLQQQQQQKQQQLQQQQQHPIATISTANASSTVSKVQTVSASHLTPQQQQNLLQSIKQQQIRVQNQQATATPQQQTLMVKQQQVLQQIQKQLQQQQQQQQQQQKQQQQINANAAAAAGTTHSSSPNLSASTTMKAGTSLLSHVVAASGPGTTPAVTRILKPGQPTTTVVSAANSIATLRTAMATTAVTPSNNSAASSAPVMTKVLTTAGSTTGQIISLESLLQKQQQLAAGTTLRVATNAAKSGSINSPMAQYAVVSGAGGRSMLQAQRFISTMATASATTSTAAATTSAAPLQTATFMKDASGAVRMVAQGGTIMRPAATAKMIGMPGVAATRLRPQSTAVGAIRMLNTTGGVNIAHISGKPVIISQGTTGGQQQQQQQPQLLQRNGPPQMVAKSAVPVQRAANVLWQSATGLRSAGPTTVAGNANFVIGGQTVRVQSGNVVPVSATTSTTASGGGNAQPSANSNAGNAPAQPTQTVMFGNQFVKLQPPGQQQQLAGRTVMLGQTGQTIRVHTPGMVGQSQQQQQQIVLGSNVKQTTLKGAQITGATTATAGGQQRVVLAVQGGGQILLPPGFQGGAINLKALQGLKMIPIGQQTAGQQKDAAGNEQRPIYAQLITTAQQQLMQQQQQQQQQQQIARIAGPTVASGSSAAAATAADTKSAS